ncbi:MAG: transketolase [bacterium]
MPEIAQMKEIATQIRMDVIRMLTKAGSGHPGGSLSAADIVTALLFQIMKHDPKRPDWPERDRFVLSKGHAIPVWYSALAHAGYFPREELMTLRVTGSRLQGHPDLNMMPCLEACTGSLGQGLSMALGMAMASRMDGSPFRVYCLMGDGESQEGQVWEAAMAAPKFKADTLCAILDYNKGQIDGFVKDIMPIEPIEDKWRSFGWDVKKINGHDLGQIIDALEESKTVKDRPCLIVADTIKGKGVSFMEGVIDWHGKAPTQEEAEKALAELGA